MKANQCALQQRQRDPGSEPPQKHPVNHVNKKEANTVLERHEAASRTLLKDQLRKNAEEVAIPRILWALGAATASELAPECIIMGSIDKVRSPRNIFRKSTDWTQ